MGQGNAREIFIRRSTNIGPATWTKGDAENFELLASLLAVADLAHNRRNRLVSFSFVAPSQAGLPLLGCAIQAL